MDKIIQPQRRFLFLAVFFSLLLSACQKDEPTQPSDKILVKTEDASVPLAWMELFCEIDRYAQGMRPGPGPRALAYMNLAAYESVMKGMPDYQSLQGLYPGLEMPHASSSEYHYPTVVNAVYARLMKRFMPGSTLLPSQQSDLQFKVLELELQFNEAFKNMVGGAVFERSQAHGEAVADRVWEWSTTDAFGHEAYLNPRPAGYSPPTGPGLWQPTSPDFQAALFPYWGRVRTFAISENEKTCRPPLTFSEASTSQLYVQALEVRNMVNELDFTNQWIAEFWSNDFVGSTFSPPTRWIAITNQVIKNENVDLEKAILTYAKVSMALNDAGVAAWHSKYTYNVERPITYIQRVFDPNWTNHWDSNPSFPAYPSGHSTFGAAAAEVLSHLFGYDYAMTDRSHQGRTDFLGMPRSYNSFYEMAEENAYSRLPLGVHFRMDSEEGVYFGYQIGRHVNEMPFN